MFSSNASGPQAMAWMPMEIEAEVEAFELPEFGDVVAMEQAEAAYTAPITMRDVEAAVAQALAQREEEEMAIREQLQQEAYAAGVEQGRMEAEEAIRTAFNSAVEALWLASEEVRAAEARWIVNLEDNVAALAAGIARHVIGREVRSDDTLIRTMAQRAAAEYPQDHPLAIRVNPQDLETLKIALADSPRTGETRWISDARVERGGCILEGRERIVDGRVDTALERVYRQLSGHNA